MNRHRRCLRVLTWNVLHDDETRPDRIVAISERIRDENPDFMMLQEVVDAEDVTFRTGYRCVALSDGLETGGGYLSRAAVFVSDRWDGEAVRFHNALDRNVAAAVVREDEFEWLLISGHLAWGCEREHERLAQVRQIESVAASTGVPSILCGDFNASADAESGRYLRGLTGHEPGAFWVDAWELTGHGPGFTSRNEGSCAQATAAKFGIDTSLLPARRIDFVMVRGWVYGKRGCPINTRLIGHGTTAGGLALSDHYGIVADLLA